MGTAASPAAPQSSAQTAAFEGTTRNSLNRQGLGKIAIYLVPLHGSSGYAGSSDATGAFRFRNLVPGDYMIETGRADLGATWSITDRSGHPITTLRLAPGEALEGAEIWFTPKATIAGKVLGPDGEPVEAARVVLFTQRWVHGKRVYSGVQEDVTDDAGEYRMQVQAPARYFVYAERPQFGPLALPIADGAGKPAGSIAGRYFPNAAQPSGATALDLHGGEQLANIDLHLPLAPAFRVSGKAGAHPAAERTLVALTPQVDGEPLNWISETAPVDETGNFELRAVPAGSYFLSARQQDAGGSLRGANLLITITDHDATGLVTPPIARFDLKGRVHVEGDRPPGKIPVQILFAGSGDDEAMALMRQVVPNSDGTFEAKGLPADRYTVRITNMETGKDGGYYLKAVQANGVPAESAAIDLRSGAPDGLELVLSADVGGVEGTVRSPESSSNLVVVLAPDRADSGDRHPSLAYLDADAHFRITDLEPGTYRIFAVTDLDEGLWMNADFERQISGRGKPVEVKASGKTTVDLEVVPEAEVRRVEALVR